MKTEQFLAGFQGNLEGGMELSYKGDVVFRELCERPDPDCSLFLADLLMRRRILTCNQPGISIAHHDGTLQFAQGCKGLGWLRSALQRIAQTHHLLNALSSDIVKHLIKGETFPVNIGND